MIRCSARMPRSRIDIRCPSAGQPFAFLNVEAVSPMARPVRSSSGKPVLGAAGRQPLGHHHAGVVAGQHDDAVDQVLARTAGRWCPATWSSRHPASSARRGRRRRRSRPSTRARPPAPRRPCRSSSAWTSRPAAAAASAFLSSSTVSVVLSRPRRRLPGCRRRRRPAPSQRAKEHQPAQKSRLAHLSVSVRQPFTP